MSDFEKRIKDQSTIEISVSCLPADCGFENEQVDVDVPLNQKLLTERFHGYYWLNFGYFIRRLEIKDIYRCISSTLTLYDKNFVCPPEYMNKKAKTWEEMLEKSIYSAIGPTTEAMKQVDYNNGLI